ncbi:head GIN domain-containing protein [Leeuwenhoekiella parthenopeia]|uniref:DUF2807 domain-containing protein n=1 Tax=Leeuwenhoekiella parthenopeia TaxID=2890320 RepID=A0ABS8GXA0_9FLAO|nr:head GIN domain-containing protein [Leeuwenhoekiella parthenopeia]MCC4214641.1 DUF2807 domain-containing protein [Leeuwenhoekiella parthenopeia]
MTTLIKIIVTALTAVFMTSCNFSLEMGQIEGTGNVKTKDLNMTQAFTKVHSSNGWDVVLQKGTSPSVSAELDENLFEYLDVHYEGNTLRIESTDNSNIGSATSRKVFVTYVDALESLKASSASTIISESTLTGSHIDLDVSSAGTIKIPVEIREINAEASSAGTLNLNGEAQSLKFEASSAGTINAKDLKAQVCNAQASSAGTIKVYVTKELESQASSGGDINYWGEPEKVAVSESSGGDVSKQ